MKSIEISEQTGSVADLLKVAKEESDLVLLESGRPIARVIPVPEPVQERIAPLHPNAMLATEDFDAPLPDEFWLGQ